MGATQASIRAGEDAPRRRGRGRRRLGAERAARLALVPTMLLCLIGYYGSIAWTVGMSFTPSGVLPVYEWAGVAQYERLATEPRWHTAFANMFVFGGLYLGGSLAFGILLAIALDQGVRGRSLLQTVFLYPIALSFIVTGLAWQWFLNPTTGLQEFVRGLGFPGFTFDWLSSPDRAIFTLVIAGVWHSAGLVMAIVYAGLGSVDSEIWRAGRVDGIPRWKMYLRVVLPMLAPVILVCVVLLAHERRQELRARRRHDGGRPRLRHRPAGQVRRGQPLPARQHRPRLRRGHGDAGHRPPDPAGLGLEPHRGAGRA